MEFRTFVLGLFICFLLSFVLGVERQCRRRALGLRTMILVSVGSYLFVSFSFLLSGYQLDVSRIAAQVVAGIGFFGAGVIIKDSVKGKIRGLTTAATLWCDAAIGMLCAGGFIKEAIVASLLVLFSNIVLRYVNNMINDRAQEMATYETFCVMLNVMDTDKVMEEITLNMDHDDIDVVNFKIKDNSIKFSLIVTKNDERKVDKFVSKLVSKFAITKYEYKKVSEQLVEEEIDEL